MDNESLSEAIRDILASPEIQRKTTPFSQPSSSIPLTSFDDDAKATQSGAIAEECTSLKNDSSVTPTTPALADDVTQEEKGEDNTTFNIPSKIEDDSEISSLPSSRRNSQRLTRKRGSTTSEKILFSTKGGRIQKKHKSRSTSSLRLNRAQSGKRNKGRPAKIPSESPTPGTIVLGDLNIEGRVQIIVVPVPNDSQSDDEESDSGNSAGGGSNGGSASVGSGESAGAGEVQGSELAVVENTASEELLSPIINWKEETCFSVYSMALYNTGASFVHPRDQYGSQKSFPQMILFIIMSLASLWQVFCDAKIHLIFVEKKEGSLAFEAGAVYYFNLFFFLAIHILTPFFVYKKLINIYSILREWTAHGASHGDYGFANKMVLWVPGFCLASTVIISFFQTILEAANDYGWDVKEIILFNSRKCAVNIFIWNQHNARNATVELTEKYAYHITPLNMFLGILQLLFSFVGNLHEHLVRDIGLNLACTQLSMMISFVIFLKSGPADEAERRRTGFYQHVWEKWGIMTRLSDEIFGAFWVHLPVQHVDHLFFSSYYFRNMILGESEMNWNLLYLTIMSKFMSFYIIAAYVSTVNSTMVDWTIENFEGDDTLYLEGGAYLSKAIVFKKIKTHPVGIGRGMTFINLGFIGKFLSVAVSLCVFLINPSFTGS